jgi:hypothetical protein
MTASVQTPGQDPHLVKVLQFRLGTILLMFAWPAAWFFCTTKDTAY